MQESDNTNTAMNAHRKVRRSTTLNRRYVKKPRLSGDVTVAVKRSPKVRHFAPVSISEESIAEETIAPARHHQLQESANQKMRARKAIAEAAQTPTQTTMTAREIKEREIKKAITAANSISAKRQKEIKTTGQHFGFGRILLALSCAALVAFAIVYFVNLNMPDLSLRVAAMQTGISASYPGYVPRGYTTSSISSENKKVTLDFHNSNNDGSFTIIEEVSSWDSSALLANYVKEEFGENYTTIREQGLTIYASGSNATWVNGGILYKINAKDGVLSSKQIRSIAVSL